MSTTSQNRLLSAAGVALAAGLVTVAAPSAKGDIDFSFSLNLGWCDPDPYCAPVTVYNPCWSDPCPPHWGWRSCYRPTYYTPFYTPVWTRPATVITYSTWSPWGGYGYTSTTFYSPYYDYYQPASTWGLTFSFGNWRDCWWDRHHHRHHHHGHHWGHGHWDDDHHHGHHWRHRDRDGVTVINNGGTVIVDSDNARDRSRRSSTKGPMAPSAFGPVVPAAAESLGVNGPPAAPAKPGRGTPVAFKPSEGKPVSARPGAFKPIDAKPIESKPVAAKPVQVQPVESKPIIGRPTLPVLTQTKPSAGGPATNRPVTAPQLITQKPSVRNPLPAAKPAEVSEKPVSPAPSKPTLPVLQPAPKAPQGDTAPATRDRSRYPVIGKPGNTAPPQVAPQGKPAERYEKPAAPIAPRQAPQAPSRSQRPAASTPAPSAPAAKPSFTPAPSPRNAPSPRVTPSAPAPRASAPSPAPRQSAPSPRSAPGKPAEGGGGKRR